MRKEHELQCQFSMFVTGLHQWDYVNYDPRMKKKQIHSIRYERDEKTIAKFEEAIAGINKDVDSMLSMLDLRFGDQWRNARQKGADLGRRI